MNYVFVVLLVLVLTGINNFISNKYDIHALLSPVSLIFTFIILAHLLNGSQRKLISFRTTKLFYWPFFTFLIVGGTVGIINGEIAQTVQAFRF